MSGFGSPGSGGYLNFGNSGSGVASGSSSAEAVPVSWLLSVSGGNIPNDNIYYDLTVGLIFAGPSGGGNVYALYETSGSWTSGGTYSGTGSISSPGGSLVGWEIQLSTGDSSGSSYSINIPGGMTIDLNPGATAPEPASMLLMGAGGAALLVMRRRKRA
jgi:hypothetical protein